MEESNKKKRSKSSKKETGPPEMVKDPPLPPPLPPCDHHKMPPPPPRNEDSSSIDIISEDPREFSSDAPRFDKRHLERPRIIRRDKSKLSRLYSSMYCRIIIASTAAFVLTEVLNKSFAPYFFQGFLFLYLFGVATIVMLIVYCYVLRINMKHSSKSGHEELKSKNRMPEISVYLRGGALLFGVGTLSFTGLEVATVFMTERRCTNMPGMVLPVLQAVFTFVQMHFIFMDSRRALQRIGAFGYFVMSHLAATNISVWVRIVVMESASDWMHQVPYVSEQFQMNEDQQDIFFHNGTITEDQYKGIEETMRLFVCLRNSTLGNIWENAMPFLYPFIIQFSWLSSAIFYTIWSNLSKKSSHGDFNKDMVYRKSKIESNSWKSSYNKTGRLQYFKIDCRGSSKGLFAGLFLLIGNIVVFVLFFVLRQDEKFEFVIIVATLGAYGGMLLLGLFAVLIGYARIKCQLGESFHRKSKLDDLLSSVSLTGICLLCAFSLIINGNDITDVAKMIIVANNILTITQAALQEMFLSEMSCRKSADQSDIYMIGKHRPGRQITTFLLFINIILWLYDSFVTYVLLLAVNRMHLVFFGSFPWGIVSRVCLPLLIFYRFHSAARLVGLWKTTYEN